MFGVVDIWWVPHPPRGLLWISETHWRDPLREISWVWWRGRWIVITDEALEELGEIDRKMREGQLGMRWRERFDNYAT